MAKSLSQATRKRHSSLSQTAQSSQRFFREVNTDSNIEELSEETRKRIIYLRDEQLEDDPYNAEVYGDLEVKELSKAMTAYGFQGVILAYPIENGKYRIESGHRRRAAAKEAKIDEYPVFITEAPKTEYERRIRLFLGNLHARDENPMTKARVAEGLYNAHKQEIQDKRQKGELEEGETTIINDLVAGDMEINKAHVGRLRALLKLIPELQRLVATTEYSWTDISAASTLSAEKQQKLYDKIIERQEKSGIDSVNRTFLQNTINELKGKNLTERKKADVISAKNVIKRGKKLITMLDEKMEITEEELEEYKGVLQELKNKIEKILQD